MQYTENYQFRKPVIGINIADVKDINFNSDRTDTLIHNTQISLAPAYDLNETYDTGNVVMYETLMYKCKEDGVTGAWDASKWERTTAGEEGSGGGGGSSVVPNPQGTPTDTLETIEIDGTVYDIAGSGGGKGARIDLLWDYTNDNSGNIYWSGNAITLNGDIRNYDEVVVEVVSAQADVSDQWKSSYQWRLLVDPLINSFEPGTFTICSYDQRSAKFQFTNTTLQKLLGNESENGVIRVYGVTYGGESSGTGGGLERTLLYTTGSYTTACPYQQDVPLLDNLSKYDFISVETGTIMDNSSGGAKIDVAWYDVSEILQPNVFAHWAGYSTRWWQAVFTDTTFNMTGRGSESGSYNHEIFRIFGYKIGAGSSGSGMSSEVIPISAGDGTTSRTFTFSKTPKKITMQGYTSGDGGWYESGYFIWGENFMNLIGAQGTIATGGYAGQAAISYGADGKSFTITASNAFGAFNRADSFSGMMLVDYGGGSEGSSEEISDMTWTLLDSTTSTGTATPIPSGTKYIVVLSKDGNNGKVTMVAKESLSNINKVMDLLQETTYILGGYWKDQAGADYGDTSCQISNGQVIAYSSYITNTTYVYAVS